MTSQPTRAIRKPAPLGSLGPLWVDPSQVPLLVWLSALVSVATFVMWGFEIQHSEMSAWNRFGSPLVGVVLVVNTVILALRSSWITAATLSTMVTCSVFLLGLLIQNLYFPLASQSYLTMLIAQYNPVFYLAAFAMFKKGAPLVCWAHYGAMTLIVLSSLLWPTGSEPIEVFQAKIMLIVIQPSYIVALSFLVRLRDEVTAKERAAQRDKEELLAMMSHEIRGPLQTMLSSVDLLSAKVSDTASRRALERLNMVTQQLDRHLKDLVEFTRLDNPELAIEYQAFDLVALIDAVIEDNAHACAGRVLSLHGPDWQVCSAEELSRWRSALGDSQRVRQVVNNLVSNALKYTSRGTVTVRLSTPLEQPQWVQIDVKDTGAGIPTDQLPLVFEPFVRLKSPDLPKAEGSGLGLAITARLIKRLGGRIQATSTLGHGSCFTVVLPLQR